MNPDRRFVTILVMALIIPTAAVRAQDDRVRNRAERVADRAELRADERATRDDTRDQVRIQELKDEFESARTRDDTAALQHIDKAVRTYLAAELGESSAEVGQAKREVRRDQREVRSDRREIRANRRQDAPPHERADDRRDRRDDRRDRRDDRRDAAGETAQQQELRAIRESWLELSGRYDSDSLQERSQLLQRLADLANAELAGNAQERKEDRKELREDRRERREDRREGR
jgi:hypothetical protein